LITRDLELELAPACEKFGLGILPWSPLAGGFLSGKFRRGQKPPEGSRLSKWSSTYEKNASDKNFAVVEALIAIAKEVEATPAQVALAWLLHKPLVTAPIVGVRTVAQLNDNLRALDVKLSSAAMKKLDEVSALPLGYPYEFIGRLGGGRW